VGCSVLTVSCGLLPLPKEKVLSLGTEVLGAGAASCLGGRPTFRGSSAAGGASFCAGRCPCTDVENNCGKLFLKRWGTFVAMLCKECLIHH